MKMKAKFKVEFESEDGSQEPRHMLNLALARAKLALKESIEQGRPGSGARTGIKKDSTKIKAKSEFSE